MAKLSGDRIDGATEDYVVTREFRKISTMEQRIQLLRCCFAIGATDGTINAERRRSSTRSPVSSTWSAPT